MKNSAFKDLLNYIDFLRNQGYFVSISGLENRFDPYTSELLNYGVHLHPVCFYLKQNKGTIGKCVMNKAKLDATKLSGPIYSCCYAGVEEYVFPVIYEGESLMCINVSGFRGTLKKSSKFMQRVLRLCDDDFTKLYMELPTTPPSFDTVEGFIKPIYYMVIELYKECKAKNTYKNELSSAEQLYRRAMQIIDNNYMYPLTCETLSSELNYSVSYLQYIFKAVGNITVKGQINNVRLNKAKYLLTHTGIRIIEIAFSCGFSDSNYFSSAFKNKYGISPKEYRRLNTEKHN